AAETATGPGHYGHPTVHTWHRHLPSIRRPSGHRGRELQRRLRLVPGARHSRTQLDPLAVLGQPATPGSRLTSLDHHIIITLIMLSRFASLTQTDLWTTIIPAPS
ncbi:hypothetical protein, partial [Pseudonocardia sp. KRD291]|uniref:hypothetical protein n=1 Tax=Pseudonocardia sp. KRD291 TaxID=2792007 RepID=UPI001C4A73D9